MGVDADTVGRGMENNSPVSLTTEESRRKVLVLRELGVNYSFLASVVPGPGEVVSQIPGS